MLVVRNGGIERDSQLVKLLQRRLSVHKNMNWQGPGTVPKRIEAFGDLVHDRASSEKIKVTEVRLFVRREVGITNVTPTDDRYHIVHDKRFVMHTVVDAGEIEERIPS